MSIKRNQPQIDIKVIFAKKRRAIAIRIEAAAARGQVYLESGSTEALADFADHVLVTIREGAFELLRSVPEQTLWSSQWSEILDRCHGFVDDQGEYLFKRCLELWGSDAQAVQVYIEDACHRIKTDLSGEVEIAQRLHRQSPWEVKVRPGIKIPPQETIKLLVISIAALALGFLLGRLI